ncbi:MAG: alkaline phosphatase family protein [Pseudomonadota bacterium]
MLLIQIDGLAASRLVRAMSGGVMPAMACFCLDRADSIAHVTMVPSSTPAFQSTLLYGQQQIVHGYSWFDRSHGIIRRFDVPEDISHVERQLQRAARRPPLLAIAGTVSYLAIFIGGAGRALLNIARGLGPSHWWRASRLGAGALKALLAIPSEVARAGGDMIRFVRSSTSRANEWNWLAMRVLHASFLEELSIASAVADLRSHAPIVYLDFLAYDEASHRRGPEHPVAIEQLRRIDRRIGRLIESGTREGYDVLVFSDHGQAVATPFFLVEGKCLSALVLEACTDRPGGAALADLAHQLDASRNRAARVRKWPGAVRRPLEWRAREQSRRIAARLEKEHGAPADEVAVVTAGSVAHIYFGCATSGMTLEKIQQRFPRLLPALAGSRGVGMVVARQSELGPIIVTRNRRMLLADGSALASAWPLMGESSNSEVVCRLVSSVIAMPSAGDLVVYGKTDSRGTVTFDWEMGTHGGLHPDELDVFLVGSDGVELPNGKGLDPAVLNSLLRKRYAA